MRDRLDAALDRHPDYPPGFRQADLEEDLSFEPRRVVYPTGAIMIDYSRRFWLPLRELQCWWVCVGMC
jgi:hypothetical protein